VIVLLNVEFLEAIRKTQAIYVCLHVYVLYIEENLVQGYW